MSNALQDPVRSVSLGLRGFHIEFIDRVGVGANTGAKLRSILERCASTFDALVEYDEEDKVKFHAPTAVLLYEQTSEGNRAWADNLPFPAEKKKGWQKLPEEARHAGWVTQTVENKATGFIAVWGAPGEKLRDCQACKTRVLNTMGG
jgi:hypothetical protein